MEPGTRISEQFENDFLLGKRSLGSPSWRQESCGYQIGHLLTPCADQVSTPWPWDSE